MCKPSAQAQHRLSTPSNHKTIFTIVLSQKSDISNVTFFVTRGYLLDALPIIDKKDTTGLRVDLSLVSPITGETQWVDGTSVNIAAPSYATQEVAFLRSKHAAKAVALDNNVPQFASVPSPALLTREGLKREKYSRLLMVARRQVSVGKRQRMPFFRPFAMSSTGDFGPDALCLLEWIVAQYKLKCKTEGPRADGLTTKELVTEFRRTLKLDLLFVMAVGMGNMICSAGLPHAAL
jgi:hypothetical protein